MALLLIGAAAIVARVEVVVDGILAREVARECDAPGMGRGYEVVELARDERDGCERVWLQM